MSLLPTSEGKKLNNQNCLGIEAWTKTSCPHLGSLTHEKSEGI